MERRRRIEQLAEENHDRWLVSYADFITLLFAFFVVMYSISSVNEGKYRILSDTLNNVFGRDAGAPTGVEEVLDGQPLRDLEELTSLLPQKLEGSGAENIPVIDPELLDQAKREQQKAASQQRVFDELSISLDRYVQNDQISLSQNGDRIEVNIKAQLLFSSGDARIAKPAMDALRAVSKSLVSIPNPVQVEGHTDNVPISNFIYPSNWELSAARAASVVHFLSAQGITPARLAAAGLAGV